MANQKCNQPCWPGYRRVPGMGCGKGSCAKIGQTPKRRKRGSRKISRKSKSKKKRGSRKNSRKKKRGSRKKKSKNKRGSRKISRKGKSKKKRGSRKISRKITRSRQKYMANKEENINTTTDIMGKMTDMFTELNNTISNLTNENKNLRTQIKREKEDYDKERDNLLRENYILKNELTALKATAGMRYQNLEGHSSTESNTDSPLSAYQQQPAIPYNSYISSTSSDFTRQYGQPYTQSYQPGLITDGVKDAMNAAKILGGTSMGQTLIEGSRGFVKDAGNFAEAVRKNKRGAIDELGNVLDSTMRSFPGARIFGPRFGKNTAKAANQALENISRGQQSSKKKK